MTFFKGHLQRKASDRKQTISLDTVVQHRKSDSSASKSASLPKTEKKGSIEIEVEHLFRQATDAGSSSPTASSQDGHDHDHGPMKLEPSLFLRFMKRRENPSTVPVNGLRRAFSHRHHASTTSKASDHKSVQSNTPDLVRDGSYDSDALFIASPRFSAQSWESLHAFSPLHVNITDIAPPDEKKSETASKADSKVIVLPPSFERRESRVISIPKKRGHLELPIEGSFRSRSLIVNNNCVIEKGSAAGSLRKKSRFTEMFHHVGLAAAASSHSLRKVSIGWMSEGKRCGYGYSFVDSDETTKGSCELDIFTDGAAETKAETKVSSKEIMIIDGQNANTADLLIDGETQEEEDKVSVAEIETISIPNESEPSRWTAISSDTRTDRNESAIIGDGIIVRDFCTKASPDRPQHEDNLEEKRRLMANAVRQGFLDTFLWMIGLGKREIARYHAGLDVQAARSQDPMFEMTVPYWDYAPKEELGNYHIEAWRAAKRRSREQRRPRPTVTTVPEAMVDVSILGSGASEKYVGRRHSSTF
jgi:hypothetical protein